MHYSRTVNGDKDTLKPTECLVLHATRARSPPIVAQYRTDKRYDTVNR